MSNPQRRSIALAQGIYFFGTGIWPLLHMPSFEAVTGPKADRWLVRTVGVLVGVIGGVLISAAVRDRVSEEVVALGVGSAAGLGIVETVYAANGRIASSYLVDAVAEAEIVAAWGLASTGRDEPHPHAWADRHLL